MGKSTCKYLHPHSLDLTTPRLILISDDLEGHEILLRALRDHVVCVSVKFKLWSLEDLTKAIHAAAGVPNRQYASVAFMDHGDDGYFRLLEKLGPVDMKSLQSNIDLVQFFTFIASYVLAPVHRPEAPQLDLTARIDLFSCNTGRGKKGKELLSFLENLTRVNWAASTNKTGKDGEQFDYVMETETSLGLSSVHPCYWDEERLKKWEGTCVAPLLVPLIVACVAAGAQIACKAMDKKWADAK